MRARRVGAVVFAASCALGAAACASSAADRISDRAGDVADDVAEGAIGKLAVGRWRCQTDQVENGYDSHLETTVAIAEDGRFSYQVADSGREPLAGPGGSRTSR